MGSWGKAHNVDLAAFPEVVEHIKEGVTPHDEEHPFCCFSALPFLHSADQIPFHLLIMPFLKNKRILPPGWKRNSASKKKKNRAKAKRKCRRHLYQSTKVEGGGINLGVQKPTSGNCLGDRRYYTLHREHCAIHSISWRFTTHCFIPRGKLM